VLSPRTTIAAAGLLLIAHAAVLILYGEIAPGPFLSNAIQLGIGSLCVVASLYAATQGGAFERRFLLLVAARYLVWGAAQGLAAYQTVRNIPFSGSVADVLFHLEDVPLGIALFLDPRQESDRPERAHALDLAQMLVFWAALYFYIHLVTTVAGPGLVAATDGLVAGFFYLRALTSRSTVASVMFGRWTPAILLSTVNDAYSGFYDSQPGGAFDLVWSLEMVVWILTAATWNPSRSPDGLPARPAVDRTVHLLPLVVAGFTVVIALGIAQRRLALAVVVVAASCACAAARVLTRRLAR
jgi:hypothetical protein